MQLSANDLNVVRTRPQSSELYFTIYHPDTVMSCRVTGSLSRGEMEIPYYNVSTGSFNNVLAGMTLLVGTSEGGRELGKIRIRDVNSTHFSVAENGHIDWAEAEYLTVKIIGSIGQFTQELFKTPIMTKMSYFTRIMTSSTQTKIPFWGHSLVLAPIGQYLLERVFIGVLQARLI